MSIYGIDLGTTNSLIGLGDTLLSGLVPSVVDIERKIAGEAIKNSLTAKRSFKVDISMGLEGTLSVVASRYVLEELKRQAGGDCVKQVVVSVPAYFSDNQRQATIKAAKLAGLEVVSLINEPTAAAMYISRNHRALSVVFDLGGGTFDVSVIDSRFDNYDVQATDGLIIGGDNLDLAIMRYLIKEGNLPKHRIGKEGFMKLQLLSKSLKENMQKEKQPTTVSLLEFGGKDITFTPEVYTSLMKLTFAETIVKTRKVIAEAIPFGERYEIVPVGGSTRCPYLMEWLEKEIGVKPVEITYDPDKVVAQGAALYAALIETKEAEALVSDVTNALSIGLSDGTVKTIIEKNSKIPISENTMLVNDVPSSKLKVNLYQGDSMLSSSNECIGTLIYDYGEVKDSFMGEVIVEVAVEASGVIVFSCKELLKPKVEVTLDRSLSTIQ
jgi:molecular chaperone DnaK (HSP70)